MSNDLENEFLEVAAKDPEYQQPGAVALAQEISLEAAAVRATKDAEAEGAWRDSGLDLPYRYKDAYAEGATNFKDKSLPNQYLMAEALPVAGYDLASGARRRTVVQDRQGTAKAGVAELKASSVSIKKPGEPTESPPLDASALGKIALTYRREGKSLEDFQRDLPAKWWEPHRKVAWDAAINAENTRLLEHGLRRADTKMFAAPADQSYEATMADPGFAKAAKTVYRSFYREPFNGTEMEAARWMGENLRNFDLNTPAQAYITAHALRSDVSTIQAYAYALEMWGRTDMEKDAMAQLKNTGRVLLDPLNLIGFGVGKFTLVTAGRKAFGDLLKRLGAGATAGTVAGVQRGIAELAIQGESPTVSGVASSAVVGAAAGAVFNAALPEVLSAGNVMVKRGLTNWQNAPYMAPGSPKAQVGAVGDLSRAEAESLAVGPDLTQKPWPEGFSPAHDGVTGFYSPVERAVENIKQDKMTPAQAIAEIRRSKDVRQEELDWMDLPGLLEGDKVITKKDLLEMVRANRLPVGERWIKEEPRQSVEEMENSLADRDDAFSKWLDRREELRVELAPLQDAMANRNAELGPHIRLADDPVYQELKADKRSTEDELYDIKRQIAQAIESDYGIDLRAPDDAPYMYADLTVGAFGKKAESNYRVLTFNNPFEEMRYGDASHPGGDEPGIIGWARMTDRRILNPDGQIGKGNISLNKPALFAEEIQSDIHSNSRKARKEWAQLQEKFTDVRTYEQMRWEEYVQWQNNADPAHPQTQIPKHWDDATKKDRGHMNESTFFAEVPRVWLDPANKDSGVAIVPDEILSKNFQPVMLKRLLFQAAKEGKDYLAWTNGEKQADYYGKQKKEILEITFNDSGALVFTAPPGARNAMFTLKHLGLEDMTPAQIAGKLKAAGEDRAAEKVLLHSKGLLDSMDGSHRHITLSKPVELVKQGYQFYDKEMVNEMNKFLKRYGSKVEQIDLEGGADKSWGIKITPELREKILHGGVPLAKLEQSNAVA